MVRLISFLLHSSILVQYNKDAEQLLKACEAGNVVLVKDILGRTKNIVNLSNEVSEFVCCCSYSRRFDYLERRDCYLYCFKERSLACGCCAS